MAHRHIYSTSQMSDAEPDQQWNRLHTEDPYIHFARTSASDNAPIFHHGENGSADRAHYAPHWNSAARLNGYSSSSQMGNPSQYPADFPDTSRDSLRPSAAPNAFMVPENCIHHASSSNYEAESNYYDLQVGNGRGSYKRKSPGIPAINERASGSGYYCAGSSSDVSSSELRQEKSTLDAQYSHWDPMNIHPNYRGSQLSFGGETSVRNVRSRSSVDSNVRSRSSVDLESEISRTHVSPSFSHHPSSSRLPIDHTGSLDHSNQSPNVPLPEWIPMHIPGPQGSISSNNLGHESSRYFAGGNVSSASGEMPSYHHEHLPNRSSIAPPIVHPTPSHTRGVRSSYTHRPGPNSRVSVGNLRMGHMVPSDDGMQLLGEGHVSRYPRPFGPSGWRNCDRSGRARFSSERYRLISEDASAHDRLMPEGLVIVDRASLYGSRNMLDHHREMRLDIDNMSYEELLALGERIGSVSTGVCEDQLPKCLTETVYCSSDQMQEEGRCVICLEEYQHMDDVAALKACGHDYHVSCIKKWLSMKNVCPVCKGAAVPESSKDKQT